MHFDLEILLPGLSQAKDFKPWPIRQIQPANCICKVFLEHSHTHSVSVTYDCLYITRTELSSCYKDRMAHKVQNIYYLDLYGKSLLTPLIES